MSILHNLRLQFFPPQLADPDFGRLLFMFISNAPEKSYWECEWKFPNTGTEVCIGLPGDEAGPSAASRQFFLGLPERFESLMAAARPRLADVFAGWLQQELPEDIYRVVKLAGFGVENPKSEPVRWEVTFETIGERWLAITIPFLGDEAQEAIVDT